MSFQAWGMGLLAGVAFLATALEAEVPVHAARRLLVAVGNQEEEWAEELAQLAEADRANLERVTGVLAPALWRALSPELKRQLLSYTRNLFDGERPLAICWRPDTPMGVVEAFHAVEEAARGGRPLRVGAANQIGGHWGNTVNNGNGQNVQGRPVTLTWSFIPDGTGIPSAFTGDSSDPSNFRAWIVGLYGGNASLPPHDPANAAWFSLFEDMFASYAAKTGLRYVYEPNDSGSFPNSPGSAGVRGDVRIGGHLIDGNSNTLAYNYFPDTGDMVLDTGDNYFSGTGKNNNSRGTRNVLEHEHGHGVGLEHVCPVNQTKLMEPFISTAYLGLQFDDRYSASRNYGDYYERHGVLRDNDSFANAAALGVVAGVPFAFQWVCIDDNSDVDYYSLSATSGAEVTARVIPSTASYLEGAQNPDGSCTAGTNFNSSNRHDLKLELIGPSQNVLATANATGAGGTEQIVSFLISQSGTHYLRVTGGTSDSAQMYRLEASVVVPAVALAVQMYGIELESHLPANGVVDPGETVRVGVQVQNLGALNATNVQGTLTGPGGFTGFGTVHGYGTLGSGGGSGSGNFVFGLTGSFGQSVALNLALTADGGVAQNAALNFTLGRELFALNANWDGGGTLPTGWSAATTGNGGGWSVVSTDSFSAPSAVFAADLTGAGTSVLTSPQVTVSGAGRELSFWHRYNTQLGKDGGVLEVSVNGGAWTDIVTAGGAFLEGGYDSTFGNGQQNPLAGRDAWSGNSGGFLRTRVSVTGGLLGVPIRFRWVMGHDLMGSGEGWYVDDLVLKSGQYQVLGVPQLDLAVVDGVAAEFGGTDTAEVRVETPLPLLGATGFSLTAGGTADAGSDVTGLGVVSLPAGQTQLALVLTAVSDGLVEGPETLTLDLAASAAYLDGPNGTAVVSLLDAPYGQWAFTNLGVGPLSGPLEDKDGDEYNNSLEYAWGTDGDDALAHPDPVVSSGGGLLKISAPLASLPADVFLFAEESADLETWSSSGMQTLTDAFGFPLAGPSQFLRIGVELLP